MEEFWKTLLAIGPYVAVIGGMLGIFWALMKFTSIFSDVKDSRDSKIKNVEEYTDQSKELADKINNVPGIWEMWEAKSPASEDAERLMKETYTLYRGIYLHRQNNNFPDEEWEGAKEEMADFVSYGYIQSNISFAATLNKKFGKFMQDLSPKRIRRR